MMITRSALSIAIDLLLDPDVDLPDAVDRHFSPSFRQRADDVWIDRTEFTDRMAQLRTVLTNATVEVLDELSVGPAYAERHTIEIDLADGSHVRTEVFVFGRRDADGRFAEIQEATLSLSGVGLNNAST